MKKAVIVLESGKIFSGYAFGAAAEKSFGEVVFNTSLSGYQEIITDPSYEGQIVTMTYPLIGNYGTNHKDAESGRPYVRGLIIKELCDFPSNFRSEMSLDEYLRKNSVMGITDVDTRAITRHVRIKGAMRAVISTKTDETERLLEEVKEYPSLVGRDMVEKVSPKEQELYCSEGEHEIAVLDCGTKKSILDNLARKGCRVRRFPADTGYEEILASDPDGIMLSNGPGDPEGLPYAVETIKALIGKKPIFGICLGSQLLALAIGGKTYKLKFGHHGGNHPVKDLRTGKVSITAQNHGFCVDPESMKGKGVKITHLNLNDNTLEGMESEKDNFFCVQFHPEAGPGPNDAVHIFDTFMNRVKEGKG